MRYLGLGKTLFNSSACLFQESEAGPEIELALSERILRKKASGVWPKEAIRALALGEGPLRVAENRDVLNPRRVEDELNRAFPFYDHLTQEGFSSYLSQFNPDLEYVTHHRCHAMAAAALSPFEKCAILVIDGAGSERKDFRSELARDELIGDLPANSEGHEECSVYLQEGGTLRPVFKRWRSFRPSARHLRQTFSEGAGILYEKTAEYIFNSGRAAGKVMGLAAFGRASPIAGRFDFLEKLDWGLAFQGKSKQAWEHSGRFAPFADLAASVQKNFEDELLETAAAIRRQFPELDRLILTGGCALNCTANMKLLEKGLYEEIYVPPFPGDESIGFGAASYLYYAKDRHPWRALAHEAQHGYFGPRSARPTEAAVRDAFAGFPIARPASIAERAAELLAEGKILGWFQGRSESGPRALGNRSILADPRIPGLKDKLNQEVKFRESFRPYGASCPHDSAPTYFQVPAAFNSPYMSFAVRPRPDYRPALKEVCHVDGTSRIQTVRPGQNALFHALLKAFGARTGFSCLLNTSLNVMGEPIVETVADARRFLEATPVHGIAVGDFYVQRAGGSG